MSGEGLLIAAKVRSVLKLLLAGVAATKEMRRPNGKLFISDENDVKNKK